MAQRVKISIIGGGVIGCAIAHRLSKKFDDIFVIEKNDKIKAENQSSRNSGVIHAGIYYPRDLGEIKGPLCVRGNALFYDFCEEFNIPHRRVGKLVVAVNEREIPYLKETYQIALANNVIGVRMLIPSEVGKMEPNISCLAAIHVPTSGIVEATTLVHQLYSLAVRQGVFYLFGTELVRAEPMNGYFQISTMSMGRKETFETEMVINAAGLYSDEVAKMINPDFPYAILPLRGEAAKFNKSKRPEIHHSGMNVYPVPSIVYADGKQAMIPFDEYQRLFREGKVLKTVGVHLTPTFDMIDGNYEIGDIVTIGPASRGNIERDDYSKDLYPEEYFLSAIHPLFPNLNLNDIGLHQSGIQAKLKGRYDWVIERDTRYPNCINLVGIDSPGLTACLAIAERVEQMIGENLD